MFSRFPIPNYGHDHFPSSRETSEDKKFVKNKNLEIVINKLEEIIEILKQENNQKEIINKEDISSKNFSPYNQIVW